MRSPRRPRRPVRRCACWSNATPAAAAAAFPIRRRLPNWLNTSPAQKGLSFGGLMTYPAAGKRIEGERVLSAAIAACRSAGLDVPVVSSGGSPDMWKDEGLAPVTEYRAGTYIYNDRALLSRGTATLDQCAMTVLATVVSRPTAGARHHRRRLQGAHLRPARARRLRAGAGASRRRDLPVERGARPDRRFALRRPSGWATGSTSSPTTPASSPTCSTAFIVSGGRLPGALPVEARGKSN